MTSIYIVTTGGMAANHEHISFQRRRHQTPIHPFDPRQLIPKDGSAMTWFESH